MTFTYDLANASAAIVLISTVRLELGDSVLGAGVRPNGSNFSDEEITVWLDAEESDPMRATARACEALSRAWATVANVAVGPRREELGKVSKDWSDRAETLRIQYGGIGSGGFAVTTRRVDGYSEAAEDTDYGS